jgi:peptidylprolyl isomerase
MLKKKVVTTPSGLQYSVIKKGNGIQPKKGDVVKIHYVGKLLNDSIFDSSYSRSEPLTYKLGFGQTIKGWEEGIALLHEGDSAMLIIPPKLGYEDKPTGKIPPNSTLNFTIKLVKVIAKIVPFDTKGKDTITLPSGTKYITSKLGTGQKADTGLIATIHYTGFLNDTTIFDSSVEKGEPVKFTLGSGQVNPILEEAVKQLNVGSKTRFIISSQKLFANNPNMNTQKNADLFFDIELLNLEKKAALIPFDTKGKDTIKTASGLKYIIIENGKGAKPVNGSKVKVHYSGYFTNGKKFDSSVERNQPFTFTLGTGGVIKGWDEGIALLNVGTKARLIVPSDLGYGDKEMGPIPAGSTLVFDIELIEAK